MENVDLTAIDQSAQGEYESAIAQAVEAARVGWEEQTRRMIAEAIAEERRQAALTDDDRLREREAAIDRRERELLRRELRARAVQLLAQRGLPTELAQAMSFEDEQGCDAGVEALDGAFRKAVQAMVNQKLGAQAPAMNAPAFDSASLTDEQYYSLNMRI